MIRFLLEGRKYGLIAEALSRFADCHLSIQTRAVKWLGVSDRRNTFFESAPASHLFPKREAQKVLIHPFLS
jgi:hypothetical protein